MFTNTKESGLEVLIVNWLVEHNGYICRVTETD